MGKYAYRGKNPSRSDAQAQQGGSPNIRQGFFSRGAARMARLLMAQRAAGFFSLDAAFAIVVAVFAYASFSLLLSSAALSASDAARTQSSSLLALRFSSFLLSECAEQGGEFFQGAYYKAWEMDGACLSSLNLRAILSRTGKNHARVSVISQGAEIFSREEGTATKQIFCASRLVLLSGKAARLEACIS